MGDVTDPSPTNNTTGIVDSNPHLHPSSPYYVHPADNPTTILYQPVLTSENYATWVRGFRKALSAKDKLGYIDVTIVKPEVPADMPYWQRCDDLVGNWVCNSCEPEIGRSVMSFDTAHEIWMDLKSRFAQSNATKLYAIKQSISTLKQEHNSVAQYYTQLKTLWDQLDSFRPPTPCICHAGKSIIEQHNQDRAMEFLQGLQDRFYALRSQLLVTEPLPSAAKLYNLVRQEEEQQGINSAAVPIVESAALAASHTDARSQRPSSQFRPVPGNSSYGNKRPRPFYDHCNRHGHTRLVCWKLHGYPNDSSKAVAHNATHNALATVAIPAHLSAAPSITAEQYAQLLNLLNPNSNSVVSPLAANCAVVDKPIDVQLPDGSFTSVSHIGPSNEQGDWME
ncbi:uncharacterized protein LOC113350688 [Papaver somniferum]|uniref:uncharacterized protein LOC113350688 n=1 Tax=Papaver somniferum TaxID=3469 RepID=UPI000E6F6110|nr:uncharacterized protein LOC113350688 [Papaver somniferum]